jgi:hypothetical protein
MINKLRFLFMINMWLSMYILGLCSSCGTSQICPAWSPSEHLLTPALSPFGARIRSHAVRRRLFISLVTAAHISPNVFSLWEFLSTHMTTSYCAHNTYLLYITFIRIFTSLFTCLVHNFISSDLLAGWLLTDSCVCYINDWSNSHLFI